MIKEGGCNDQRRYDWREDTSTLGGREREREGGREGGRDGGREGEGEEGRDGGREGGMSLNN